jgi:glycosyltransferase involved in cell wall biosynthesis
MTRRPVVYDVSRLVTRVLNRTPNGIDRVDFALADHFVDPEAQGRSGLMMTTFGPRVLQPQAAREALDNIRKHWGEDAPAESDAELAAVAAAIDGAPGAGRRVSKTRRGQYRDALAWIGRHGLPVGRAPRDFLSGGGVYLNVSQFLLEFDPYVGWPRDQADIDSVFFLHDLLPIEAPEYFLPRERGRHLRRLRTVARRARGVIVSSGVVAHSLRAHLAALGRSDVPILVAPLPPDPIFAEPPMAAPEVARSAYFLVCGTIEPRKNHLLLLNVWRELAARLGPATPKLVVIGERGWRNEHVLDCLDRSPTLAPHVVEASGLTTPSVKRLIAGARAVLIPSFAEGYGLPLVEAFAAGAPVIASDIPVFREVGQGRALALDPTDGPGWREAIVALADAQSPERSRRIAESLAWTAPAWPSFFAAIEDFLSDLKR